MPEQLGVHVSKASELSSPTQFRSRGYWDCSLGREEGRQSHPCKKEYWWQSTTRSPGIPRQVGEDSDQGEERKSRQKQDNNPAKCTSSSLSSRLHHCLPPPWSHSNKQDRHQLSSELLETFREVHLRNQSVGALRLYFSSLLSGSPVMRGELARSLSCEKVPQWNLSDNHS